MKANRSEFPFLTLAAPWSFNPNPIWLASTLTLSRNLNRYKFPAKMGPNDGAHIRSLIQKELETLPLSKEACAVGAEGLGFLEKEFLYEHFLTPHSFQHAISSEGFVIDREGKWIAIINLQDHLQLHAIDCSGETESTWNRLTGIERELGKVLPFAFSSRFGFLTGDPSHSGTGLIASTFLHLPALIHTQSIEEIVHQLERDEVDVADIQGGIEEPVGDVLVLSNRCTLGLSEENILHSLHSASTKLMVEEKRLRAEAKSATSSDLKDKVSRAYGLLRHSYQMEAVEAWSTLSLMKLGLDLEWIKGTTHQVLNELLITIRRAHLVCEYNQDISQDELPHRRAELIHATLGQTELTI